MGQGEAPEGRSSTRCSQASSGSTVADLLLLRGTDASVTWHERTQDAVSEEVSDSPAENGEVPFGASSSTHLEAASGAEPGGEAEEEAAVTAPQQTDSQTGLGEVLAKPEAESCPTPEATQQSQQSRSFAAEQTAADAEWISAFLSY